MLIINLIRHGKTKGNTEKRYIGRTDERVLDTELSQVKTDKADKVFSSPLRRCIETAYALDEEAVPVIMEELRECDFGRFEGKNYQELNGDEEYQKWVDSNGTLSFPDGEDTKAFKHRAVAGFKSAVAQSALSDRISIVTHGGCIMAILEHIGGQDFYDYQVDNLEGYEIHFDGEYTIAGKKTWRL